MQLNWVPLLVMVFAPLISDLIQLGLSRIREYDADLGSAILLGDPKPLASALAKMEYYKHSYIGSIFTPILKIPEPSLLRTHPPTQERINRLLKFARETQLHPVSHPVPEFPDDQPVFVVQRQVRSPRRRLTGFWY